MEKDFPSNYCSYLQGLLWYLELKTWRLSLLGSHSSHCWHWGTMEGKDWKQAAPFTMWSNPEPLGQEEGHWMKGRVQDLGWKVMGWRKEGGDPKLWGVRAGGATGMWLRDNSWNKWEGRWGEGSVGQEVIWMQRRRSGRVAKCAALASQPSSAPGDTSWEMTSKVPRWQACARGDNVLPPDSVSWSDQACVGALRLLCLHTSWFCLWLQHLGLGHPPKGYAV